MEASTGEIRAVGKALLILEAISQSGKEISLNDLARQLNLPASTAHRLLKTLKQHGYVAQHPVSHDYGLGPTIYHLTSNYVARLDVRKLARPIMEALAEETQETVHLTIAVNFDVVDIDAIESSRTVSVRHHVGTKREVHATAVGRLFLAFIPYFEEALREGSLPLPRLTPRTLTTIPELEAAIERTRAQGYATNFGERDIEAAGVAAPLFNAQGQMIAALGVSGPATRLPEDTLDALGKRVAAICAGVPRLGGRTP